MITVAQRRHPICCYGNRVHTFFEQWTLCADNAILVIGRLKIRHYFSVLFTASLKDLYPNRHFTHRWINQIHRDDAASALAFLLEKPGSKGIFNVADDSPLWQEDCYAELSRRFNLPMPPLGAPDPGRSRGWTNKRVSNAKLRALGWAPRYPSYFDALDGDPELVPSITDAR